MALNGAKVTAYSTGKFTNFISFAVTAKVTMNVSVKNGVFISLQALLLKNVIC